MCNILPCHTRYRKRADGTEESYSYDKADRLSAQTDKNADGSLLHSYTYTYDGAGNVIKIGGTADTAAGHAVMTYDKDNRLATYNGEKVTYDERGNMLHGPLNGEMGDYTYDCRNRLIETKAADGTVTAYTYDAENTRLTEETANTRHTFVTDKETTYSQLLTETISEKHLLTYKETATITYTYGNGLISDSKKEAKDSDTEKRYYHYNHIGSTTAITDADGDLLYSFTYGTYGELTGIYDADGQKMAGEAAGQSSIRETLQAEKLRFLYNGRYGVETGADGLYYMRARYYNPQIKRFINRDIIDGSITDSQSLNKYSYVQGNPVNLIDPFGLCAQDYFSRAGHELLDWLGFIFDPADVINFLWYTAEGNAAMAAATAVAIVPAAGSFIAKGTKQAIKAGKKAAQKAGEKAAKNATEKAAKKAAKKKLAKEAAEKGAEKAAKEAAEKATEKMAKETAEKAAEKGIKSGSKNNKMFKDKSLLDEHYGRHGQEIADVLGDPNYSMEKYLDDANYIVNNGTYVPELNGYVSFMNGKKYGFVGLDRATGDITTFHAMERMAPDTSTVRAELSRRAEKAAKQKGLEVGTKEYYEYCSKYVEPRNIPPSVIEDAIFSSKAIPGNRPNTFIYETLEIKVVVNSNGKVITVIPK